MIEENDGFKVVAHGYAASVQVEDLRHRAIGIGMKAEPDSAAGKVVAVQRGRHSNRPAIPDCIGPGLGLGLNDRPARIIQIDGLPVGEIAHMHLPPVRRKKFEARQSFDRFLG